MIVSKVIDIPVDGPPAPCTPVLEYDCTVSGLRLAALPPGEVEVRLELRSHLIDINFDPGEINLAVNSDRFKRACGRPEDICWAPAGTDFRLKTSNSRWGLLLELDTARAASIEAEALDGADMPHDFLGYSQDALASIYGRHLIRHLRRPEIDPLFAEGLGLAIVARSIGLARRDRRFHASDRLYADDPRITRVIDYIETHFGDELSVGELATVAAMSPGHFSRVFKTATGEPVWAYVQRRRCERAQEMLEFTRESIAEVAHACGFSSQAHFTHCFRQAFGVTLGALRRN